MCLLFLPSNTTSLSFSIGSEPVAEFSQESAGHPDQNAVSYVLHGLGNGFPLGFTLLLTLQHYKGFFCQDNAGCYHAAATLFLVLQLKRLLYQV